MLKLISLDSFVKNLKPVTSMLSIDKSGGFHENGLYSESIFGPEGSKERRMIFSYIELHAKVIHPAALRIILQLDRKIEKFLSTEMSFVLDDNKMLVPVEKGGVTGIKEFIKMFPKIKFRGETDTRDKLIDFLKREYKRNTIFIDKLPIIPPDLRPAFKQDDGNWMIDPLNDMYISVMRRASQVRSSGSGPLFDLLNYALQNIILEHDNFVRSKISKKSGIIRKLMLGKRVDFSGRAVITPGPEIKPTETGIPMRMAVGLFEPFIMHRLLYSGRVDKNLLADEVEKYTGLELSVDSVKKVLKAIKENDKMPETLYKLFYDAAESAMEGRVVVLKRDPVLQTQSYMAYKPVLHRGNTILMSTVFCSAHNADFDGDCTFCSINFYKNNGINKCHISELHTLENLEFKSKNEKKNGIIITKYKCDDRDLYIDAIDIKTGNIDKKKILEYSIHENIEMYKVHDHKDRFEDLWVSYDHSLIIFDESTGEIRKASPRELLEQPKGKYLIRDKNE